MTESPGKGWLATIWHRVQNQLHRLVFYTTVKLNDHWKLGLQNIKGQFLCSTMTSRSAISTKTTTKWILEVSELLDIRLTFMSSSTIWKWPHQHPRSLQVSGMHMHWKSCTMFSRNFMWDFPQRTHVVSVKPLSYNYKYTIYLINQVDTEQ